ncbi:MAG: PilT/PilU family type 4a pilus ATPase, partial [Elusimicrobia bacterium]|nr:PilT/PilU family type 4a pilus ATPase [Elusimicrobiota bacterium]
MPVGLDLLLRTMLQHKASDLHIRSGSRAYVRVDGVVKPVDGSEMTAQEVQQLADSLMDARQTAIFRERKQSDFALDKGELGRFRCNVFVQRNMPCIAVRHIPNEVPTFAGLNLPAETLKKICGNERGLVLVTGITGSGKTSTLAAMIDSINSEKECHVITIEDPIEFLHKDKCSVISQREVGTDTLSFVESLRGALRQDPDVILVGEMRDLETTQAAVTAAETGHLVFGTVHTTNAYQTISRILDLFPPYQQTQVRLQLAASLKAVVSQRLLPCTGGGRIPAVEILVVSP